ncbi:unnamed protein product [Prunus armeniaca]|uniref:Uncharacterized protein n=1 Tax=Prunus armeniaca TaxID=36596 RepID=A0A6J5W1H9_PRUAR|nr:unnamed protein product [Prunus armeniaca]CAB4294303.1 unnamed protein product [Prunus armeniaca]
MEKKKVDDLYCEAGVQESLRLIILPQGGGWSSSKLKIDHSGGRGLRKLGIGSNNSVCRSRCATSPLKMLQS